MSVNEKLRDIIRYILIKYPYPFDLNKTRLTKLVYLIDWKTAQKQKNVSSGINWYFDNYGPYVPDVMKEAVSDEHIIIDEGLSNYGGTRYTFQIKDLNLILSGNEILTFQTYRNPLFISYSTLYVIPKC